MTEEVSKLYFEAHVTIEPVFDDKLELAGKIATKNKFKIASLLMKKRDADIPERSMYDTFMTGHSKSLSDINQRLTQLVIDLKNSGFKVWRYKVEDTVLDSRVDDCFNLLDKSDIPEKYSVHKQEPIKEYSIVEFIHEMEIARKSAKDRAVSVFYDTENNATESAFDQYVEKAAEVNEAIHGLSSAAQLRILGGVKRGELILYGSGMIEGKSRLQEIGEQIKTARSFQCPSSHGKTMSFDPVKYVLWDSQPKVVFWDAPKEQPTWKPEKFHTPSTPADSPSKLLSGLINKL